MLFVSSFGYYFDELSYSQKMSLHRRTNGILLVALTLLLLLLLPLVLGQGAPQLQWPPRQPFPPGLRQNLGQPGQQPFIPLPEFFCQWTPLAPAGATQQQCIQAFDAFTRGPTLQNFCASVATFCTAAHLTLCPRPATAAACRTCMPQFQRLCQQQQQG